MVKKSAKARREQRQAERQQQQSRLVMIIGAVVLILGAGLFILSQGNVLQYEERFDLDPILGNPDAPITIIEYGAYGCEACKAWHEQGIVDDILAEYNGQVNFIYRDMPIIFPAYSQRAAQVAQCGLDQGNDSFWTFHDAIFHDAQQGTASNDDLISLGEGVGLDGNALRECVNNGTHAGTVAYDLNRGRELGINATPTWFINGERVFNANPDTLRQIINRQLSNLSLDDASS